MNIWVPRDQRWIDERIRKARLRTATEDLSRYRDDPVAFAEEVLGVRLWSGQRWLLQALVEHDMVAVRSGHKTGKSLVMIVAALWWVCTRPYARAILTAPTFTQVKNVLWRELRRRYPSVQPLVGGTIPKDPSSGIDLANGAQILGLSTNTPENIQGLSSDGGILFEIDEASGYPDELYEVLRGNMAGSAKMLAASNPSVPHGWFARAFEEGSIWDQHVLNSEELALSPERLLYVDKNGELLPGLATEKWLRGIQAELGPNFRQLAAYGRRVTGDFPTDSDELVIALSLIVAAEERWVENQREEVNEPIRFGVDPARQGDDATAASGIRGHRCEVMETLEGETDGEKNAEWLIPLVLESRDHRDHGPTPVLVDGRGNGAATVDMTRRIVRERGLTRLIKVLEHDGAAKPEDRQRFHNRRAEVWYAGRDWIAAGGELPRRQGLDKELMTARVDFAHTGSIALESKQKQKRRGVGSPNRADALTLAVVCPVPSTARGGRRRRPEGGRSRLGL